MERLAFSAGLPLDSGAATITAPATMARPDTGDGDLGRRDTLAYKALLAFTFVLFIRPQDQLRFLEPLHLAEMTAVFALIALVIGRLGRGVAVTRLTPELVAVLAFGGVMLATAPFSLWPGGAVGVFTDLYMKVLLVFALIVNTVTTRARLVRMVNIIVLGTSYIAVRAVFDYVRGVNLVEGGRATGAVGGLFGNPNDMALNMVAFLPLAVVLALGRSRPMLRLLALVGIPAIAGAIIFSKSRGGTIGLVAMLLVLLYQMRRVRPRVATLVIVATIAAVPALPASFTDRMASIFNAEEDPTGSREARKRLLREGYRAFLENPIFGLGAGQFQNYNPEQREEAWRETHNAVLQVASELGIGGVVVFVVIVASGFVAALRAGSALRGARRARRARAPDALRAHLEPLELYAAALAASLTGWLMAAMFASVAYYWTLYLVLGLAVTLRDITMRELGLTDLRREACRAEAA
jgi:putative inorganic carbon (HCO3(-)) transporter